MDPNEPLLLTVSQFIAAINAALKSIPAKVIGEIIKIKQDSKGHVYFTIKDKKENAVIDAIMWAFNYKRNGIKLVEGMEVILGGNAEIYAQFGKISFIAKTVELVGEGALKKAYDDLKRKLTTEGLFAPERKRQLPSFPERIGIITSKQGAVIHDFANNIGKRGFSLQFVDSRVEGKEALFDLLQAIKTLQHQKLDLLVLMRGGGSRQSLAAFDSEAVVRAIADFPVPVIAAIGHHQDVPLAALSADCAVSTPTAAANLVSESWDLAERTLERDTQTIVTAYQESLTHVLLTLQRQQHNTIEKFTEILHIFQRTNSKVQTYLARIQETLSAEQVKLTHLFSRISRGYTYALQKQNLSHWTSISIKAYTQLLATSATSLAHCEQIITLNDPMRLLKHGYSLVRKDGVLVKQIKDVTIGDSITVMVSNGTVISKVETTRKE